MTPVEHWKEAERLLEECVRTLYDSNMRYVMVKAARLHFLMATEGLRLNWPRQEGTQDRINV